jgi:hypothetical protein
MRRAKRGIHLGSHCDAYCGSRILRLHAWPKETRARLVEYARCWQSGGIDDAPQRILAQFDTGSHPALKEDRKCFVL